MKTCRRCSELKDESAFGICRGNASGRQSYCKACMAADKRERYGAKERDKRRDQLLRKYGLTQAAFKTMLAGQKHKCGICREDLDTENLKSGRGAVVDHDHKTGKVRGILCNRCNKAIGLLRDNPSHAQGASCYLVAHNDLLHEQVAQRGLGAIDEIMESFPF